MIPVARRQAYVRTLPARHEGLPAVTTIFLEPDLLRLETTEEAATQLRYLAEWGARLVVVADEPLDEWEALGVSALRYAPSASAGRRGDWWLTAEPGKCAERPGRGVRTVLIGGTIPPSTHPTARCDLVARDLRGAVLEILARQAMPERTGTTAG
jgi:hypothetical protein